MGQKVNPIGMRLGIVKNWTSNWYAGKKDFSSRLNDDLQVRQLLEDRLKSASVSRIQIERPARNAKILIYSSRPGVIIGKKGEEIEALRLEIAKVMKVPVHITIEEIRKPELDAKLVAEHVAQQLERRIMFRRVMKRAIQNTMRQGALGVKISVSGRLSGSEIARTEWYREGRVPLHTFRADIDYATATAKTTYGTIGVKIWIFKGEIHSPKAHRFLTEKSITKQVIEKAKGEN
ncbi:30S ribosomal protein S3 [Coxiella endosymbiont of Amblyomma americanum]|uniref:30S ribosomal protein S3 n=1 Tax=Coxiella endosymbiont of Amblyomma americanum TaxID=325775 RepID=UPI00057CFBDF|nr:30S ribosomal protein S3 [Coxiella endosymbiont of Amblyomma americanum]AJC50429.1 30S ribosomal protein S3 [Coxiella endosymbiont of Amblyomma americanum]AUJ58769.1 30S ribosomal protein S3 [Coxiella-like endosymbiont of Amblyomma americanum]